MFDILLLCDWDASNVSAMLMLYIRKGRGRLLHTGKSSSSCWFQRAAVTGEHVFKVCPLWRMAIEKQFPLTSFRYVVQIFGTFFSFYDLSLQRKQVRVSDGISLMKSTTLCKPLLFMYVVVLGLSCHMSRGKMIGYSTSNNGSMTSRSGAKFVL